MHTLIERYQYFTGKIRDKIRRPSTTSEWYYTRGPSSKLRQGKKVKWIRIWREETKLYYFDVIYRLTI